MDTTCWNFYLTSIFLATVALIGIASAQSGDEVPDFGVLVSLTDNYPRQVEASCISLNGAPVQLKKEPEDKIWPFIYYSPGASRIPISWEGFTPGSGLNAYGLICRQNNNEMYEIAVPLMTRDASCVPKKLTSTVSPSENLVVEFVNDSGPCNIWHKEPAPVEGTVISPAGGRWKTSSFSEGKLDIPYTDLTGSGFYAFVRSTASLITADTSHYGRLSVLRRECDSDRYGIECQFLCPDCMYGGVCHPFTGKCVCAPGRRGDFCEEACPSGKFGRNCSTVVDARTQICLPFPYGCTCPPGYYGVRCSEECKRGTWGVDCSQSCRHCVSKDCDRVTGECTGYVKDREPCVGGPLGLPRLRQWPRVSDLGGYDAAVRFNYWNETTDDGVLPPGSEIIGYRAVFKNESDEIYAEPDGDVATVTNLTPGTTYEVAVLVNVRLGPSTTCLNDGSLNTGSIKRTQFRTRCPLEAPVPTDISVVNVTDSGFNLTWKDISYKETCRIFWTLFADYQPIEVKGTSQLFEANALVEGLRSNTLYNMSLVAYIEDPENPAVANFSARTFPKTPLPKLEIDENGRVLAAWSMPDDADENVFFQYDAWVKYLACPDYVEKVNSFENLNDTSVLVSAAPYTEVLFQLRVGNEAGLNPVSRNATVITPSKVPLNSLRDVSCDSEHCYVTLEDDCTKINGDGLTIQYELEYDDYNLNFKNKERENQIRGGIRTQGVKRIGEYEFQVTLPDNLLNWTYYTFTPYIVNGVGINGDSWSWKRSERFRTGPKGPFGSEETGMCPAEERPFLNLTYTLNATRSGSSFQLTCPFDDPSFDVPPQNGFWNCGSNSTWDEKPDFSDCRNWRIRFTEPDGTTTSTAASSITSLADLIQKSVLLPADILYINQVLNSLQRQHEDLDTTGSEGEALRLNEIYFKGLVRVTDKMIENPVILGAMNEARLRPLLTDIQERIVRTALISAKNFRTNRTEEYYSQNNTYAQIVGQSKSYFDETENRLFRSGFDDGTHILLPEGFQHYNYTNPDGSERVLDAGGLTVVVANSFQLLHCATNEVPCEVPGENDVSVIANAQVNSIIMGAKVGFGENWFTEVNKPVEVTLRHVYDGSIYRLENKICVWWNTDTDRWSTDGCEIQSTSTDHHTICHCSHLTNLAVIMDINGLLKEAGKEHLYMITESMTLVGCSLSIIFLAITITCFVVVMSAQKKKKKKTSVGVKKIFIRMNLCICLLLAEFILLLGLNATKDPNVCAFIAALLHYFFLATFGWSAIEALNLYFALKKVFETQISVKHYMVVGYGGPLVLVGITLAAVQCVGYGSEHSCWLEESGVIWSFAGSLLLFMIVNMIAFVMTMRQAWQTRRVGDSVSVASDGSSANWRKCSWPNTNKLIGSLGIFIVLGLTWITGFFYMFRGSEGASVLFVFLNSLQGFGIFLFGVALDKVIRNDLLAIILVKVQATNMPFALRQCLLTCLTVRKDAEPRNSTDIQLGSGNTAQATQLTDST